MSGSMDKAKEKGKFKVSIYGSWCKKCGICVAFCRHGALKQTAEGDVAVTGNLCNGCMQCEYRCPDFAITVEEDEEK